MPDAKMFLDRRKHQRVQTSIPVRYRVIDDQKEIATLMERRRKDQHSTTVDLSEGGAYIATADLVGAGSLIRLEVKLPGATSSLSAFAEVVWANESGCGLRYLAMKDDDAKQMREFIEKSAT
jgi:c-di-GMP-binding flagellar brake protein YcgR